MDAEELARRMDWCAHDPDWEGLLPYARALIEAEKALEWTIGYFCEAGCAWPSEHVPECLRFRAALASLRSLLEKGK